MPCMPPPSPPKKTIKKKKTGKAFMVQSQLRDFLSLRLKGEREKKTNFEAARRRHLCGKGSAKAVLKGFKVKAKGAGLDSRCRDHAHVTTVGSVDRKERRSFSRSFSRFAQKCWTSSKQVAGKINGQAGRQVNKCEKAIAKLASFNRAQLRRDHTKTIRYVTAEMIRRKCHFACLGSCI